MGSIHTERATNLRCLRGMHGLEPKQLARVVGVRTRAIAELESGKHAPSAAVAVLLARAFGVQVHHLWGDTQEALQAALDARETAPIRQHLSPGFDRIFQDAIDEKSTLEEWWASAGKPQGPIRGAVHALELRYGARRILVIAPGDMQRYLDGAALSPKRRIVQYR